MLVPDRVAFAIVMFLVLALAVTAWHYVEPSPAAAPQRVATAPKPMPRPEPAAPAVPEWDNTPISLPLGRFVMENDQWGPDGYEALKALAKAIREHPKARAFYLTWENCYVQRPRHGAPYLSRHSYLVTYDRAERTIRFGCEFGWWLADVTDQRILDHLKSRPLRGKPEIFDEALGRYDGYSSAFSRLRPGR